jgi:hypothetical protein
MAEPIVRSFVIDTSAAEQNLQQLSVGINATTASLDAMYAQLINLDGQLKNLDPNTEAFADVNTQIKQLETTITQIETGKIDEIGTALEGIDAGNAAQSIEKVGDAVEQAVAPVTQLANATDQLNTELKDTKVDTSSIETASADFQELAVEEEKVVTSSKSLKAQLRELQAELANTEPDSAKYNELAAAAGQLKDQIGDAAEAVGTQAGGAFERVSGSLGLVTGRIANLDFEGAAEGAQLLAKNITEIKPGDITKGIKGIGSAFASIGKALLTNPIFLIGAAIAAAVVYSEELLSLVDGVSSAEQERLAAQQESAKVSKQQLDEISQQENILKLQGKTEREILEIKIAKSKQAIIDQKAVIATLEIQRKAQIDAAKRNADITKGIVQFLTIPVQILLGTVDTIILGLNKVGVISDETFASIGSLREGLNNSITGLLFDPEQVAKDGDKLVEEANKTLQGLENTQAGFQLSIKSIDDKAASERKTAAEKNAADLLKIQQDLNKQLLDARNKSFEESKKISEQIRKDAAKPVESVKTEVKNFDTELAAARTAEEQRISFLAEGTEKEIAIADLKYARLRDAAKGNAELQKQITQQNIDEVTKIEEDAAQKRKANEFAVQDAKLQATSDALGAINGLVAAFAKGDEKRAKAAFKIQKAVSIAQATVDTYKGANAIFANAAANPSTILFPAQPFIAAGVAIASGLANVATIAQQQFQGGSTGGGGGGQNTPSLPEGGGGGAGGTGSQPAQFNPLASSFLQDRPEQLTPRAYVLAGDVASQQEVREKVQDLARIG